MLVVSLLICVSFVDRSRTGFGYDYTAAMTDTAKKPVMVVEEITIQPMIVLAIRDTANTMAEIGPSLGKNYGAIGAFMGQNGLQMAGAPLAWYHTEKEPFILEAGIPVDKKPAASHPDIQVKEVRAANAVVVHFWGPYELTPQGYEKIREWLKKNNKKAAGPPFDQYVTDPTTVTDPYQVQTNIIQIYQ